MREVTIRIVEAEGRFIVLFYENGKVIANGYAASPSALVEVVENFTAEQFSS